LWETCEGGDDEGHGVGSELVEERGEEVHGLETVDAGLGIVTVIEGRDNEEDEIAHETDDHHPFAAIEFIVDEKRGKVISTERDANIDQVIQPTDHYGLVVRNQLGDELGLEELIAVEEDVVAVPSAGGSDQARSKVSDRHLE